MVGGYRNPAVAADPGETPADRIEKKKQRRHSPEFATPSVPRSRNVPINGYKETPRTADARQGIEHMNMRRPGSPSPSGRVRRSNQNIFGNSFASILASGTEQSNYYSRSAPSTSSAPMNIDPPSTQKKSVRKHGFDNDANTDAKTPEVDHRKMLAVREPFAELTCYGSLSESPEFKEEKVEEDYSDPYGSPYIEEDRWLNLTPAEWDAKLAKDLAHERDWYIPSDVDNNNKGKGKSHTRTSSLTPSRGRRTSTEWGRPSKENDKTVHTNPAAWSPRTRQARSKSMPSPSRSGRRLSITGPSPLRQVFGAGDMEVDAASPARSLIGDFRGVGDDVDHINKRARGGRGSLGGGGVRVEGLQPPTPQRGVPVSPAAGRRPVEDRGSVFN
ncbi:hypothetical protein HDV00_009789 [Rhizophlyctis rosea]|nr:hypothetical protein HDV00_009789 [Rhizophlyctis rosea]